MVARPKRRNRVMADCAAGKARMRASFFRRFARLGGGQTGHARKGGVSWLPREAGCCRLLGAAPATALPAWLEAQGLAAHAGYRAPCAWLHAFTHPTRSRAVHGEVIVIWAAS